MKPRSALLGLVVCGVAACSLSGATVTLGGSASAGSPAAGGGGVVASAGSTMTAGGSANASGGTLNVDGGDTVPVFCTPPSTTTVSGRVWDPAGKVPLYNAVVYVPDVSGALPAFPDTVACEKCTDRVPAITVALSGPDGSFVLKNVPVGNNVPLVVQLGKWRSKIRTLPPITPCQDNPIPDTNRDLTRLPADQSEGDIPKIALSTGHSDALECLLRKIGIHDSEFTTDAGKGRVNMFVGCAIDSGDKHFGANKFTDGTAFPSTNELFDSGELNKYDVVIFSCEGHKCDTIQTPANVAQLVTFANQGGRVFLDHDHYNWLKDSTGPIEKAAQFDNMTPDGGIPDPLTTKINNAPIFPKGVAFAQWLVSVKASTTLGSLDIHTARTSVESLSPNRAQSWIYRNDAPIGFFYFTIGTPVAVNDNDPAPEACGRVVFTDLHVSDAGGNPDAGVLNDTSDQDTPFPKGCVAPAPDLTPQEKALEFMIFDLTSCVQQETAMPVPPMPK